MNNIQELKNYRDNPILALKVLFGVELLPIQQAVFCNMWYDKYTLSMICRGGGKTFLLALNAALKILLYKNWSVCLDAPSFRQRKMILREVTKYLAPGNFGSVYEETTYKHSLSIPYNNSSITILENTTIDIFKKFDMLCIDQASSCNCAKIPASDSSISKVNLTSTGFYSYNNINKLDSKYKRIQIPYWLYPKYFFDPENLEAAKLILSEEEFKMEYEAAIILVEEDE